MPVKLIAIGALAVFELAVLGMMLFPRVEPTYRAVFIDRTSECWPHPVSGAIEPQQRISFLARDADGPGKSLLRCGWLKPWDSGTWSAGPESRLLLLLEPNRAATLDIELRSIANAQRVEVTANGEALTEWAVTAEPGVQVLTIPPLNDGRLELGLHFPDAIAPRDLGIANDRRKLAIELHALTLRYE